MDVHLINPDLKPPYDGRNFERQGVAHYSGDEYQMPLLVLNVFAHGLGYLCRFVIFEPPPRATPFGLSPPFSASVF